MKPWILRDGTTIELGGKVEGSRMSAIRIRGAVSRIASGDRIKSGFGTEPSTEYLDFGLDYLVDYWLRDNFDVKSGPVVEYPNRPPSIVDPTVIY